MNIRGIILLDGPDAAGKSTLAEAIRQEVFKREGENEAIIRHLGKPLAGTCWKEHSEAVIDYAE